MRQRDGRLVLRVRTLEKTTFRVAYQAGSYLLDWKVGSPIESNSACSFTNVVHHLAWLRDAKRWEAHRTARNILIQRPLPLPSLCGSVIELTIMVEAASIVRVWCLKAFTILQVPGVIRQDRSLYAYSMQCHLSTVYSVIASTFAKILEVCQVRF